MVSLKDCIIGNGGAYTDGQVGADCAGKTDWCLTEEALNKLLNILDTDRERAGQKYELLRRKLLKFFEIRGCQTPDEAVDETFNVVAKRIVEGQVIVGDQPSRYFYGVARNLLREYWRRPGRLLQSLECMPLSSHPHEKLIEVCENRLAAQNTERQLEALEHCLLMLPEEGRQLIVQYYANDIRIAKTMRVHLAKRLGIPANALRIRAHRIRMRLREHLNEYLETHPANEMDICS